MLLMGCTTNVTEYSRDATIPNKISVIAKTVTAQTRTSISSAVYLCVVNFFLQHWGYEVVGAGLVKLAAGLLALFRREVVGVLALVAIPVFAACQPQYNKKNEAGRSHTRLS